jgi:NADPH-dependent F420 reductase
MANVSILGGTGKEGTGLALALVRAGRTVYIGSRDEEKGQGAAAKINDTLGSESVRGGTNREAAKAGALVLSTLPHEGQVETLVALRDELRGKVLVTAAIAWPPGLTGKPSAAEEVHEAVGDTARVVAAFQTVSAATLRGLGLEAKTETPGETHETEDVLVFSDDKDARQDVARLVDSIGLRGVHGGKLANARVAEAITGVLLAVNKAYKVKASGIRITGLGVSSS